MNLLKNNEYQIMNQITPIASILFKFANQFLRHVEKSQLW
jgi:hypothetical protein